MKKYNHAYSISFSLVNTSEDGEKTKPSEVREALLKRLASIDDNELMECVGYPYDTYEEEAV